MKELILTKKISYPSPTRSKWCLNMRPIENKTLIDLSNRPGYQNPGGARYRCDIGSVTLKEKQAAAGSNNSVNQSTNLNDENEKTNEPKNKLKEAQKICKEIGYKKGDGEICRLRDEVNLKQKKVTTNCELVTDLCKSL